MAYWPFFPWKAMQNIIISTPPSFSTQPKITKAATTFPNTLDILPPAAQMPTAAPGSRGPQILTHPLPHHNTRMPWVSPAIHATSSHSLSDALQLLAHNPMYLGQDTPPPSPTSGPYKPLQLTIPPPSPPPAGHPLPPVQAPHSSSWSPRTRHLTIRQKSQWEDVGGCRQGPRNVSYEIKAAAES